MSTQTAFRLPDELIENVDRYAAHSTERLGISVTRTDAVKMLLRQALAMHAADHLVTPAKKKAKKK